MHFINAVKQQVPPGAQLPNPRLGDHRGILIANHQDSTRELQAAGFEQIMSAAAGLDSLSVWQHPDGTIATVAVRDWNLIRVKGA